jgi:hypothetical protein
MALLSSRGISTPSLPAQGEQRRSSIFNIPRDIPPSVVPISADRDAAIKAYSYSISACCAPFRVGSIPALKHISRLIELALGAGPGGAMIVVDHPSNVAELAHAVARLERSLNALIEHAAGYMRIGVASATGVFDLTARIGEEPSGGACLMTANR